MKAPLALRRFLTRVSCGVARRPGDPRKKLPLAWLDFPPAFGTGEFEEKQHGWFFEGEPIYRK